MSSNIGLLAEDIIGALVEYLGDRAREFPQESNDRAVLYTAAEALDQVLGVAEQNERLLNG